MADESYANKSLWHVLLPRKVRILNEGREMGISITSWKWFAQKCFIELKQQLIAVSSHKKLEKGTVQPTIHSMAEPPSLAEVEFPPILLRVYHISCPHTQHQAGFWWGKWRDKLKVCEWGGDELPSHLEEFVALFCPLPPHTHKYTLTFHRAILCM